MIRSLACRASRAAAVAHNCATNIGAAQATPSRLSYSQNMRPPAAAAPPRRGRNSSGPEGIATTRRRAQPHRASTAPQHGDRSLPGRQPRLDTSRRTSYRHHRGATSWHRPGGLPRIHGENENGEGRCHHRHGHGDAVHQPPHHEPAGSHQNDTVNMARDPCRVDILNGG